MSTPPVLTTTGLVTPGASVSVAEPSSSSRLDWVLLLVPGVIWGTSFLFIAEGLEALAPDGVSFMRFVIGFLTPSATTFLMPVVALLLGVAVRGERVPAVSVGGSALCLAGAWLIRRGTMRRE